MKFSQFLRYDTLVKIDSNKLVDPIDVMIKCNQKFNSDVGKSGRSREAHNLEIVGSNPTVTTIVEEVGLEADIL